jgi:hypothetical protein
MFSSAPEISSPGRKSKLLLVSLFGLLCLSGVLLYSSLSRPHHIQSMLDAEEREFRAYISAFSKRYSPEEFEHRLRIFSDNMAYIRVFNARGDTFVQGATIFTDLSPSEFKSLYTSPRPYEIKEAGVETRDFAGLTAPATVDWRTKGVVTPVKNQGNCGSCWSFSATGGIECAWAISGKTLVSLSEQQLMDCSKAYGNDGCNGGYYRWAYSYVIANGGITTEANYPYTAKDGTCNKTKAAQIAANISKRVDVAADSPSALMNAIALQPTSVSVEADQAAWQNYKSGTISANCGTNLDHDVLAVGYDSTANPPFWIVKNSWGTSWGMQGYLQIAITNGKGVCGINMTPGYPVV